MGNIIPRYKFTLTDQEKEQLEKLIQKGGKGYRIKHAQIPVISQNSLRPNSSVFISSPKRVLCISTDLE